MWYDTIVSGCWDNGDEGGEDRRSRELLLPGTGRGQRNPNVTTEVNAALD
jgi:hypothetical protein